METRLAMLEDVRNQVGRWELSHMLRGVTDPATSHTVAIIDNRDGRSAEVVDRILRFADALLYEVDLNEYYEATDFLEFQFDGRRFELVPGKYAEYGDLGDFAEWEEQREAIRKAESLRVNYAYTDEDLASFMVKLGFHSLLKDLLAEGRLADRVTLYTQVHHRVECFGDGLEEHISRTLVVNGLVNGEYVDGELPFVENDALIRSLGGWRQSVPECDDLNRDSSELGLYFRMCKPLGKNLEARLRKCLHAFQGRVNCKMETRITDREALRFFKREEPTHFLDALEDITPAKRAVGEARCRQEVDFHFKEEMLMKLPDYTAEFTESEMEKLEAMFGAQGDAYIRNAANSECPQSEMPRIRLAGMIGACRRKDMDTAKSEDDFRKQLGPALMEKLRALWNDADDRGLVFPTSGPGDWTEEEFARQMCRIQHFVLLRYIYLSGIEDVRAMCALLDELDEIAALANASYAPRERETPHLYRITGQYDCPTFDPDSCMEIICSGDAWRNRNLRERFEAVEKLLDDMPPAELISTTQDGAILFEAENRGIMARLRFRKKDGRYICEIAGADI